MKTEEGMCGFSRSYGTDLFDDFDPALKRRAIIDCAYGTGQVGDFEMADAGAGNELAQPRLFALI